MKEFSDCWQDIVKNNSPWIYQIFKNLRLEEVLLNFPKTLIEIALSPYFLEN